ncbi:MAG: hypothetical protein KatS3mg090_0823 [Patescibacteria group bacterium]|nr:MAG: hypothetical protein KatS3mg090_0823 [Patescibacteria group bacterium]
MLKNIPRIRDVNEVLHIIKDLGGEFNWIDENTIEIRSNNLNYNKVDMVAWLKNKGLVYVFSSTFI